MHCHKLLKSGQTRVSCTIETCLAQQPNCILSGNEYQTAGPTEAKACTAQVPTADYE